jgi:hypothetical protein
MPKDHGKTAYISTERKQNSVKYIAKVFDKPQFEISKAHYNAIVKELGAQDWANTTEDEASVISRIISSNLETPSSDDL